eukprot:gene4305-5299_t
MPCVRHEERYEVTLLTGLQYSTLDQYIARLLKNLFTLPSGALDGQHRKLQLEVGFGFPVFEELKHEDIEHELVVPTVPVQMKNLLFTAATDIDSFAAAYSEKLIRWATTRKLYVFGHFFFSATIYNTIAGEPGEYTPVLVVPNMHLALSSVYLMPQLTSQQQAARPDTPSRFSQSPLKPLPSPQPPYSFGDHTPSTWAPCEVDGSKAAEQKKVLLETGSITAEHAWLQLLSIWGRILVAVVSFATLVILFGGSKWSGNQ